MREHGAVIIDSIQRGTTQRCPHCGGHFLVAASGDLATARSTLGSMARPKINCLSCGRLTCGRTACVVACIPLEAQLEHAEGKRTRFSELIETGA